ncbi:MAG: D-alanyl-D-alanine carboxypeptidase [Blastocatellia bacterium]
MKRFVVKNSLWSCIAVFGFAGVADVSAQQAPPLLQDIKVYREEPAPSATPFVKKTGSSTVSGSGVAAASANPIKTSIPALGELAIPGYSGILVETIGGETVVESGSNYAFNPASNVKVATSYAVLKTFGPEYRFPTNVWTDGALDRSTGTLVGNLYVSGRDPVFGYEHAVSIAQELNKMGIRSVQGDLVVTDNFAMNYTVSVQRSSQTLFNTLDNSKRSSAAVSAWNRHLANSGKSYFGNSVPNITFTGGVYVQSIPSSLSLLFSHESAPMRDIVKAMMSYSNNFLSERLGDMLGGPYAVSRVVQQNAGVVPAEFYIQTSSGLGINRVTPLAMMKLLRVLRSDLAGYGMDFADIMPVAGVDKGTLENRFDTDFSTGSVIGKTGTLGNTDGGVSSLAGEISTRNGKLLFVIFNQRGSVNRFRSFQNFYVSLIQGQFGGAMPVSYKAVSLDVRLARTRISYPDSRTLGN